jgi:hypothetical protein
MKLRNRDHEKAVTARGLTQEEAAQVKALKKRLGFKNSSQLVNYLLDKYAPSYRPSDNETL